MPDYLRERRRSTQARHERLLILGTEDHYLDPLLYDHEYSERDADVDWYRELAKSCRSKSPVLELGAGTGRVAIPIAEDGSRIIALDRMPSMLERLQQRVRNKDYAKRIETVEADMRELPNGDASTELVLAPFNALMHLYTWQDLLKCFREVFRVLKPGGLFAFDVQLPDLEWLLWDPDSRHAVTPFVHPKTAERLIYSTNHRYDPQTQVVHVKIFYDQAPPPGKEFKPPRDPKKLVHLAHRQIFPEELRMLVAIAGLELDSLTGDFDGIPLRETNECQVAVCRKPGDPTV